MYLKNIDIIKSPAVNGKIRLLGEVTYDRVSSNTEIYWFDVPEDYAEFINDSGNPWLVCLLPLAVTLGEPLRIGLPVDRQLLENAKRLMRIWKCWYAHLHIISIEADSIENEADNQPQKTAAFFSGGVDSFFTVLRHSGENRESEIPIDDFLSVWGFDIPIDNRGAFYNIRQVLSKTAVDLGKNFIDISTNLRQTHWKQADWTYLSHGAGLISSALVLEKRYSSVLIASTGGYMDFLPWGSHVLTDPLLSTSRLKVIHDGAEFKRIEKTELVAKSEIAMKSLHVCWKSGTEKNCSNCSKCFRTMMMLDLFGTLRQFTTFKTEEYDLKKVSKFYIEHYYDRNYMNDILSFASQKGRTDLIKAVNKSIRYSKRLNRIMPFARKIKKWLQDKRFFWRWADLLERILLRDSIC